ncbi:MAG: NADPH-quinone reductase [Bdellovibrio sp. ArHS]|uniref:NAD(P)H-dependent oxidoreductase n=1 Tax=Bdellovibrio sp. ArHS TaxID=1569284 RepID=UPI0005826F19|nr:NAD(P)H-dependent oxidoreductase [Bdellovibrio sp. ArHS]KHD88105.1 MAG: NADPH-quinone reductase [Bdellovibrio sp. ArHS]
MKKILVINGHPNKEALGSEFARVYEAAAKAAGFDVKLMNIADLQFDPILHKGYLKIQELEPDLLQAQKDILWAEHIVITFPMWWGTIPALLKGFLDRTFLPGFAFKYHKNDPFWDRLLKGRTGRIIFTTDAPWWYNWIVNRDPAIRMMKTAVMEFCGIKPVGVTQFDNVKNRRPEEIKKFLQKVQDLGTRGK